MKKAVLVILSLLYLTTSMGTAVQLHFCMGKLTGWGIIHTHSTNCGMKKTRQSCCGDEIKIIKNNIDQRLSQSVFNVNNLLVGLSPCLFRESYVALPLTGFKVQLFSHAPPRTCPLPLHILNCVYRI